MASHRELGRDTCLSMVAELCDGFTRVLRPLVRQTSSSPCMFACISKTRPGWIPFVFISRVLGPLFSSQHPCAMLDSISDECEVTASF